MNENRELLKFVERGRCDPSWYMTHALDVREEHLWPKMREMNNAVRDHERTSIGAGHGVSKTYTVARLALGFLTCYYPSTVVTTAPTGHQVKDLLWREIRQAHSNARVPLGGKLSTTMLDMQHETGVKWFATGFSTRPDTVTKEATAFQGYHNDYLLIIFDEAAGILPEIWRAAEHIGAPFKRFVAIGNPTSAGGDFAASLKDPTFHHIRIAVTDTPNFKTGKPIIPGVYGREYERRIRLKYGEDSDEYRVRVKGETSRRRTEGAYYGKVMYKLRESGRITNVPHDPHRSVWTVWDPGYTTAIWFFQLVDTDVRFIRYYEDSGCGVKDYVRLLDEYRREYGYHYGGHWVACDMDSNATRIVTGQTALETARDLGLDAKPLAREYRVSEGIARTEKFLHRCWFDQTNCARGIECLEQYHERKNKQLSTEDVPVFTGQPEEDYSAHGADAMRYASMAAPQCVRTGQMTAADVRELHAKHRRP